MLTRSHDRKVTNSVSANGKASKVANAFGLPAGSNFSCPMATLICDGVCYAGKLEKIYSGVRGVLMRNWEAIQGKTTDEMSYLISVMIDEFRADSNKRNAELIFRIHWDGDFWSMDYAQAWANVVRANPDIQFWVYTRSFHSGLNVLPIITGIDNLAVYISVDSANVIHAQKAKREFPSVNVAMLAQTMEDAKDALATGFNENAARCPELNGNIPLIDEKGSACAKCKLCVKGRGPVLFSISKPKKRK